MKHAAPCCLAGLGGWLAVATTLSALLQMLTQAAWSDTLGASALAGLIGWAALNLLHAAFQAWREHAAVGRGHDDGRQPADGARAVLVGTLEALGPPLRAPLDGSACLAYEYRITEDRGSGRRRTLLTHVRGHALTPSEIVTSSRRHRLLDVPDLQASAPATPSSGHIAAFEAYARTTRFTPAAGAARELEARWTDDDGASRADVCFTPLETLDLARCQLAQQHVPPGAPVCLIGTYSKARGGLVPSPA